MILSATPPPSPGTTSTRRTWWTDGDTCKPSLGEPLSSHQRSTLPTTISSSRPRGYTISAMQTHSSSQACTPSTAPGTSGHAASPAGTRGPGPAHVGSPHPGNRRFAVTVSVGAPQSCALAPISLSDLALGFDGADHNAPGVAMATAVRYVDLDDEVPSCPGLVGGPPRRL